MTNHDVELCDEGVVDERVRERDGRRGRTADVDSEIGEPTTIEIGGELKARSTHEEARRERLRTGPKKGVEVKVESASNVDPYVV